MKKLLSVSLFLLVLITGWQLSVQVVQAGNNLIITCNNEGPCTSSPNAPLFSETNLVPGETRVQTVTIVNNDSDDTCQIGFVADDGEFEGFDLSTKFFVAVTAEGTDFVGIPSDGAATNALSYRQLFDNVSQFNLGILSPGSSRTYTWLATFDEDAGNEYQGLTSNFEIVFGFTCAPPETTPARPGGSGDGPGGGSNGTSNSGTGGSPGSPSILGATTNQLAGLTSNFGGQILGTDTAIVDTEETSGETAGEVAGAISDICSNWKQYLPWILLAAQILLILLLEFIFRRRLRTNLTIWALATAATMVLIVLFYLFRECNCFTTDSWQYQLCQWYWIVAIALALVTKLLGHKLLHVKE